MPDTTYKKRPWRQRNVAFLVKLGLPLPCDYMEFFGESGIDSCHMLQEAGLIREFSQFCGVDKDVRLLLPHSQRDKAERPRLIIGDGYRKAIELAEQNTAIFNFDGFSAVGEPFWRDHGEDIQKVVRTAIQRTKFCALILNNTLDVPHTSGQSAENRLREHVQAMCRTLAPWKARPEQFLGRNLHHAKKVRGRSITKGDHHYVGAVDLYRSANKTLRMTTVRMVIKDRVQVERECK